MKYKIYPSKIVRSRKIQLKQFESEEIKIEMSIEVQDLDYVEEALAEATKKAIEYLDLEERKLRNIQIIYSLQLTEEGKATNALIVDYSKEKQYENYIHLWYKRFDIDLYIGFLHRLTGEFKFKEENMEEIEKLGIEKDIHFVISKEE